MTNKTTKKPDKKAKTLLAIAQEWLNLETLETRKCGEDFQEQAIWCIKAALEAAYEAGRNSDK
ncbi:MAG: hypothetical protein JEZ07_08860 [Phycisphaerae bacterium]|nr:hypothetical protein [Phycisphaerae bacterium]